MWRNGYRKGAGLQDEGNYRGSGRHLRELDELPPPAALPRVDPQRDRG
jgi:hypothetical protein